jgi:death-on-curing protein
VPTPDADWIVYVHDGVIATTGGASGIRDMGALLAAVERPQSGFDATELFPTVFLKAAALGHGIATSHPFTDGNKRTALLAAAAVLRADGYRLAASANEKEATMVSLALKETSLEQFAQWLEDHAEPL